MRTIWKEAITTVSVRVQSMHLLPLSLRSELPDKRAKRNFRCYYTFAMSQNDFPTTNEPVPLGFQIEMQFRNQSWS